MARIAELEAVNVETLNSAVNHALPKIVKALVSQGTPDSEQEEHWIRLLAAFPLFAMRSDMTALLEDLANRDSIVDTWSTAREQMKKIPIPAEFAPLMARVIEKRGRCEVYEVGDEFAIPSPFYWPKPCSAVWLALWPYIIGVGFGYKSWEYDDPDVFRISCPSKKGIVIEIRPSRPRKEE